MKVEYIEPFVHAAYEVIEKLTGEQPTRGALSLREKTFTSQQVTIVVGVTGPVEGQALYGMSIVTATKMASSMIGQQLPALDAMATSAIAELGNMITAHATARLASTGMECDITPPSVLRGINVEVSTFIPALVVPVTTGFGKIEINVSLGEVPSIKTKAA